MAAHAVAAAQFGGGNPNMTNMNPFAQFHPNPLAAQAMAFHAAQQQQAAHQNGGQSQLNAAAGMELLRLQIQQAAMLQHQQQQQQQQHQQQWMQGMQVRLSFI
jgi:hypothetical protein